LSRIRSTNFLILTCNNYTGFPSRTCRILPQLADSNIEQSYTDGMQFTNTLRPAHLTHYTSTRGAPIPPAASYELVGP